MKMPVQGLFSGFVSTRRFIVGLPLAASLLAGCTTYSTFDDTASRTVHPFVREVDSVSFRAVGLARSQLLTERHIFVNMASVPIGITPRGLPVADPLAGLCIAELKVKPAKTRNHVEVLAKLQSPFFYLDEQEKDSNKRLNAWLEDCSCPNLKKELRPSCFAERLAATVDTVLQEDSSNETMPQLSAEGRALLVRAAGRPFASYDLLRRTGAGLARHPTATGYLLQILNPGDELCFHSQNYAATWLDELGTIGNTQEPGHPACFPWQTIGNLQDGRDRVSGNDAEMTVTIGTDPMARFARPWSVEKGRIEGIPHEEAADYLSNIDSLVGPGTNPFRFALLFTENSYYRVPADATRDLELRSPGNTEPDSTKPPFLRGSFLILARDRRLIDTLRRRVSDQNDKCGDDDDTFTTDTTIHRYLECVTKEWAMEALAVAEPEVPRWMRDIVLPDNVRPFVRIEVVVDGAPLRVRAGTTLLNLVDRRLALSTQVFSARSRDHSADQANPLEQQLVAAAVPQLEYRRRAGLGWQTVDLATAGQLEDLLIPLQSGDRITWLR